MEGPLLDTNQAAIINNVYSQLMKESEVFGLTLLWDGAKTMSDPFTNMMAVGAHDEAGLFDIAD